MTDPVIFAFYRDGEPKESAVLAPPVPLEVLRSAPLAGSAFDVAERFPGRAAGPVYMSLPHGMETWHAVCALTSDDDGIQAARDFFCTERLRPARVKHPAVASALIALSSCGDVQVVTVREDDVMPTYVRSVHMCGKYDYYLGITWSPENITATLRTAHIGDNTPGATLLQDWNGGFFTEPIPSTYLLELFFSARPEKVTYVAVYTAQERRPHRNNNIICFQVAGKTYYAANNAIVPAHPIALGWHFHKDVRTVSVQKLMYGPLPKPQ